VFKRLSILVVGAALCLTLVSPAGAAPVIKLKVGFSPDRPGVRTTVTTGFTIQTQEGIVPPPLTGVQFRLPTGMGLGTTDLGERICTASILELQGVSGCPSNSYMGLGKALVEVPFGPEIIHESVSLAILMAPALEEHTTVLFLAYGVSPVAAEIIFHGELLNAGGPYGAELHALIPLTPTLPGAPDAAVVRMRSTLGPEGVTYYKTSKGQRVPFRPSGMVIPKVCPRGGYPFAATFTFLDGSTASATSAVPCKTPRSRRGQQRK
jgi:hypothetical protein